MGRITLLFLFLCLSIAAAGQMITVSEEINLRNDHEYELIGEYGGQTLLYQNKNPDYYIIGFDQSMQKSWEKELELDRRQPHVLGVMGRPSDFAVIYRFREKGHTVIKAHKYDPAANLKDSTLIVDLGYLFYTPNLQVIRSEDRSKVMVYYMEKRKQFNLYVFDVENMSLLWDQQILLDDTDLNQDFIEILLSNTGRATVVLDKNNTRSKRENHYFEIHEYDGAAETGRDYIVAMTNYVTYDVSFEIDNLNNTLIAAGCYSEKSTVRAQGFFYLNIPPDNHKEHLLVFHPFEKEFVELLLGEEVKKNKGIEDLAVQELVLRRDGGVLMIAERTKRFERRTGTGSRAFYDPYSRQIVDYYFDELIVISVHPTGETHWKTVLHKKQYSQDDDAIYSSYFLMKTPSSLRFLYNDEIKYENTVSEYVLRGDGAYDRNALLSTKDLEIRLRFKDALQVDSDRIIVPSERRNRLKLVRLEY